MKLELSLYAIKLKNAAGAFKGISDPFAVVTKIATAPGEVPRVLGKTEVVKNTLSPDWVKVFHLHYELGTPTKVAVNIFDEVRKGNNIGMGSAVFDIAELLGARGSTQAKQLKAAGTLYATLRRSDGTGVLRFKIKGYKLKNVEGLFGKSDPFYEISRKEETGGGQEWDNVYRSRAIQNNLDPDWEHGSVELSVLCGGNHNKPIRFDVYDWEKSGKHKPMGHVETSVAELLSLQHQHQTPDHRRLPLQNHKHQSVGYLVICSAETHGVVSHAPAPHQPQQQQQQQPQYAPPIQQMAATTISQQVAGAPGAFVPGAPSLAPNAAFVPGAPPPPPTVDATGRVAAEQSNNNIFVDYISGGCELNVVVAVDFTGSNGDPRQPGTLHYLHPNPTDQQRNDYERAMAAIISILAKYDSDQLFPVMGFGAKYGGVVRHCFQCGPNAQAKGLSGVLQAYKQVFQSGLIMSGPTVFTEVMETAAARAQKALEEAQSRAKQAYTILLILTDGAVTDVNATAQCLARVASAPLSIVIVGVGSADFAAMQFLDDCQGAPGKARDIAQFVAFREHAHNSQSLTKATLEEIPDQMVQFFQSRGIAPNPPVNRGDSLMNVNVQVEPEVDMSLDIREDEEIVVTGGGNYIVDGYRAT